MDRSNAKGFTLIELGIVLTIAGMILAFGLPAVISYSKDLSLSGGSNALAGQLRLLRNRAQGTRTSQTMKFTAGYQGTDYRVENGGVISAGWKLPTGITYSFVSGTVTSVTMTPDGYCATSGMIILQNPRGSLDTISVLASGLVLTK